MSTPGEHDVDHEGSTTRLARLIESSAVGWAEETGLAVARSRIGSMRRKAEREPRDRTVVTTPVVSKQINLDSVNRSEWGSITSKF